jgi:co-chaperonin GroES (HSP10)
MEEETFPFKPLSNFIVIQVIPKKKSNIIMPDTAQKQLTPGDVECKVVAISEQKEKDGTPMVRFIKIGDNVVFGANVRHTGEALMIKKQEYIIVRETDIIGLQVGDFVDEEKVELTLVN